MLHNIVTISTKVSQNLNTLSFRMMCVIPFQTKRSIEKWNTNLYNNRGKLIFNIERSLWQAFRVSIHSFAYFIVWTLLGKIKIFRYFVFLFVVFISFDFSFPCLCLFIMFSHSGVFCQYNIKTIKMKKTDWKHFKSVWKEEKTARKRVFKFRKRANIGRS